MIKSKHYIELSKPIKTSLISDVFFEEDLERIFNKGDKMQCPFCQQELRKDQDGYYTCYTDNCECMKYGGNGASGSESLWLALIHVQELLDIEDAEHSMCHTQMLKTTEKLELAKKELEQSEICCSEWEKQALDYKAENIALSGDLERTRKALEIAVDTLKLLNSEGKRTRILGLISITDTALDKIAALDKGGNNDK